MSKGFIRKQIDKFKGEIFSLKKDKDISPSVLALINSMLQLLEIMALLFLEKKACKNSNNSGLPPSKGFGSNGNCNKKVEKKDTQRTGGRLDNSKDLETSETVSPQKYSECNGELKKAKVTSTEEREEIDIAYEIHTHTVVCEIKEYPQY